MVIVFILLLIDYFLCFDLPIYLDVNLRELEKQRSQLWRFFANWAIFGIKLATTFLQKSPAKFGRFLASLKNGRFWAKFAKLAGEMGDF